MAVTAEAVKLLRERTGAGMMECKRALVETQGDLDAAAEMMRKAGLAKADKKASRIAAEGVIAIERSTDGKCAAIVEVNCETDFVARENDFIQFAAAVARAALASRPADLEALAALPVDGGSSIEDTRRALIAKIGENMSVRRFELVEAAIVGSYLHGTRIGALVAMKSGDDAVAKDIAMHVAATNPLRVSAAEVPAEDIARERDIFAGQARNDPKSAGKPQEIVDKIVEGKVRKWLGEITLLGQPFVKDDKQTVEQYLRNAGGEVASIVRYEVGAGIEKKQEDFAEEVRKQVESAKSTP
ncbi:elongation factor Ts [Steroidobacter denitrificans]|uniref:Elongation factor Ts n=1 Tax=Steroidobacter denitrificans TaxID=465721 RepID=A0A127FCG8_STEDE|nr:translation elongation factor Ts [Steroidobacter denitrificans]AMN47360.1 elongation factor Ts [Steroidobacter denitrificans]